MSRTKKMSTGCLLMLQPEELKFHFDRMQPVSCSLHMTNKTDECVVFKFQTTRPIKYYIQPNIGIMPPRSTCDVVVTLHAQEIPTEPQSQDKVRVQWFVTTPHFTEEGISTDMFNEGSGYVVEERILEVLYVLPEYLVSQDSTFFPNPQELFSEFKRIDGPHTEMMTKGEVDATPDEAIEQFSTLAFNSFDQYHTIRDLEDKLKDKEEVVAALRRDLEESRQKQNDDQRKAEDLKRTIESLENIFKTQQYSQFSYTELQQATNDFESSVKIGEGENGSVYKGFLRHSTVAIKKLDSQSMQGLTELYEEVEILSKVRHPNLVNFLGACSFPKPCLVYEFLPNGSLEDRLSCKDNTPPLNWQARIRIAAEICSALIFLHSYKPKAIIHGNLKPSNIHLDANLVMKLTDFGIHRRLSQSSTTTKLHGTEPKGTLPYVDPKFVYTGELTTSSDIYSFGIILLQLLTNRPALGVVKGVQYALTTENLHSILDESAGEWPFIQAKSLALLGVACCKMKRRSRPRLETEVWMVLEPMVNASSPESSSFHLKQENDSHIPSYFLCPIVQEVMRDPQVAADGFTYEAEAIRGWFDSGHNTSPMTNLQLAHHQLLPNHALRSVIQEWLQQQHRQ